MKHIVLIIGILFYCMTLQSQIVVNENPDPLVICDENNDGFGFFNLHDADDDITLGDSSLFVTYHSSIADAESRINVLDSPYMNQLPYVDTVYAHVSDLNNENFAMVPLDLLVLENPQITQPIDLVVPDDDGNGIAAFNLTVNDDIMLAGLNSSDFIINYYLSETDAIRDEFPIINPSIFYNTDNPQRIYARVQNIDQGCFVIASFLIKVELLSIDSFGIDDLNIFPNPTSEILTLKSSKLTSETSVSIYDIRGRRIFSENHISLNGVITLNVAFLETGVYFVKVSSEGKVETRKLVKR